MRVALARITFTLLAVIIDPNGHASTTVRDAQAHVLKSTDARGSSTQYSYNQFGEVVTTTYPLGTTTTNIYDTAGTVTQSSTPLTGCGAAKVPPPGPNQLLPSSSLSRGSCAARVQVLRVYPRRGTFVN
jgi:YD repeat-containing protein